MKFWENLLGKSKEEKQKEENKIRLRADIQKLIQFINSLIEDLKVKLGQSPDKSIHTSFKKVKYQLEEAKDHLEGADKSLQELNIELGIKELEEADEDINSKNLSDNAVNYLIEVKKLSKNYLGNVNYLRTNIDKLIRTDLPHFKSK
ncbi:MAG: hypothetical protein AABX45_02890 [Nanoarchaeota archaeon]